MRRHATSGWSLSRLRSSAADGLLGAADDLVKLISRDELVSTLQRLYSWQQPWQAKTILATDDDPMALALVDAILSQEGFQISKASGGEEGIAAARLDTPALIILDLLTPELDGFAVVEQLRADPATATTPIVILTHKPQPSSNR
jgi:CheY-like chemotaxis protein